MAHTRCSKDKSTSGKDNTAQTPSKDLRQPDTGRSAGYDIDKTPAHCISNEEHFGRQPAGATGCSPTNNNDISNSSDLTGTDSDAEYNRLRLLPEHYVAPRRQRRLPHSVRTKLASVRGRRLSFNGYDEESDSQEVMSEYSGLQLSDKVGSLYAQSFCPEPQLSNENARRRLFDSDNTSMRKSFYTIIQSHDNPCLSNRNYVATIQSILDTVFGSIRNDNSCPRQARPHNTSFSDDNEDLASSDEDCNNSYGSSDNNSPDLSSEEEYAESTVENVYFLPKSQLSVFDLDLHSASSLYPVANEDSDNRGYCATENSDTDNENQALYNSDNEGCNKVNDSEEEAFTDFTSSEDNSRTPAASTTPFSPVINDHRRNVRLAEDDSDVEYNHHRPHPELCAAPRRQRRLLASRRSRPSPLSRRRLCFDDFDDERSNQRAMSESVVSQADTYVVSQEDISVVSQEDTSVVSQEDTSVVSRADTSDMTSLLSPSNKYLYALNPPHDYLQHSRHVNVASILSILNDVFNPPSCDNRFSFQFSVNNNSPSEHYQSVYQPSLVTDPPTQYSMNNFSRENEPYQSVYQPGLATDSSTQSSMNNNSPSEHYQSVYQSGLVTDSSTQSSMNNNSPNENEPYHSVYQSSLVTDSPTQFNVSKNCPIEPYQSVYQPGLVTDSSTQSSINNYSPNEHYQSVYQPGLVTDSSTQSSMNNSPSEHYQSVYQPGLVTDSSTQSSMNNNSPNEHYQSVYQPGLVTDSSTQSSMNNSPNENEPYQSVYQHNHVTDSPTQSSDDVHEASEDCKQTEFPLHPPSPGNSDDPLH